MGLGQRMADADQWLTGTSGDWEVVIGMEVHAQVKSNAKLFSGASTEFGGEPNAHVSLVDAAMPGMLPVINKECVRQAIKTGLGLRAKINLRSVFDRKNYFYPDLPQGYQISQYQEPIVGEGCVTLDIGDGGEVEIGIERLHLEQDAGKSIHDQHPSLSYVDLNRSGVALMEIVSKPDLRSSEEAKIYLAKLRAILRYLDSCDGDMEKGSMRADVNVSVRRPGGELGTRCEIKNVNSIRFAGQAIEYEARRQIAILEEGGSISQQTRLFDPKSGETRAMRSKEEAHDYRYFPDPDLLPLEFTQAWVDEIQTEIPELPDGKKARLIADYGLSRQDALLLVADRETADYFEQVAAGRDAKAAVNWIMGDVSAHANNKGVAIAHLGISPGQLGRLLDLIQSKQISGKIAKSILEIMVEEGGDAEEIAAARGWRQLNDPTDLANMIDAVIDANPEQVQHVKEKPKTLGWFVGQVMAASKGQANPQLVNKLLRQKLQLD